MARGLRPSDVHRAAYPPAPPPAAILGDLEPAAGDARTGRRRWQTTVTIAALGVAVAAAAALTSSPGPTGGSRGEPASASGPRSGEPAAAAAEDPAPVSHEAEETAPSSGRRHAMATLALHAAEVEVVEELLARADAAEGTPQAGQHDAALTVKVVSEGIAHILEHRDEVERLAFGADQPDRLALAYWNDPEHDHLLRRLLLAETRARDLALLDQVHQTLYGGTNPEGLADAGQLAAARAQVEALAGTQALGPALQPWALALLAEPAGQPSASAATAARARAYDSWREVRALLVVPALEPLRAYLAALPEGTVLQLRAHSYFGQILARLDSPHSSS